MLGIPIYGCHSSLTQIKLLLRTLLYGPQTTFQSSMNLMSVKRRYCCELNLNMSVCYMGIYNYVSWHGSKFQRILAAYTNAQSQNTGACVRCLL